MVSRFRQNHYSGPLAAFLVLLAGCGGGSVIDRAPQISSCATLVPSANPADTITVVLFDRVDLSHAPWGRNREERFVFGHLYETLVTVDCHGEVGPALAKSWKRASDGWLFELRDDAHFWDESAVTAKDVVESLQPAIDAGLALNSVAALDDRRVLVYGGNGPPDITLLALPVVAVTKQAPETRAPIGTGAWMIDEGTPVAEAVVMRPASDRGPVVRLVQGDAGDARDVMDGAADAIITDEPGAVDYARSRPHTALAPLAWDRVYVLISRERGDPVLPEALCDALARDVVRVDARGGTRLLIESEAACNSRWALDGAAYRDGEPKPEARLVFASNDLTARALAERIVALATMDTSLTDARAIARALPGARPGLRAVGVAPEVFETTLQHGKEVGYVMSFSWCADFPCPVAADFFLRATWLAGLHVSDVVTPLVETRAHFVALSNRVGFIDDGAGNVRIGIAPGGTPR